MTGIVVKRFDGLRPAISQRKLNAEGAQIATNTRLDNGKLRSFRDEVQIIEADAASGGGALTTVITSVDGWNAPPWYTGYDALVVAGSAVDAPLLWNGDFGPSFNQQAIVDRAAVAPEYQNGSGFTLGPTIDTVHGWAFDGTHVWSFDSSWVRRCNPVAPYDVQQWARAVWALYVDRQGGLWARAAGNQFLKLDKANPAGAPLRTVAATDFPTTAAFDADGNLYYSHTISGASSKKLVKVDPAGVSTTFDLVVDYPIARLVYCPDKNSLYVWTGGYVSGELYEWDIAAEAVVAQVGSNLFPGFSTNSAVLDEKNGYLWGTSPYRVRVVDTATNTVLYDEAIASPIREMFGAPVAHPDGYVYQVGNDDVYGSAIVIKFGFAPGGATFDSLNTIFRHGQSASDTLKWITWADPVEYMQTPVHEDEYDRLYWSGLDVPRYAPAQYIFDNAEVPAMPVSIYQPTPDAGSWKLGVPAPLTAPGTSGGTAASYTYQNREYRITFVKTGYESMASNAITVRAVDGFPVLLAGLPTDTGGDTTITHKRIYRRDASVAGSKFKLVVELPIADTEYSDSVLDAALGAELSAALLSGVASPDTPNASSTPTAPVGAAETYQYAWAVYTYSYQYDDSFNSG